MAPKNIPSGKADWRDAFRKRQVGVSDMTLLSKVTNQSILDNLRKRFESDEIYTYIGYVLISVNPFRDVGNYTPEILQGYMGKNPIEVPPHVYAIAENAYFKMTSYKENQCVIISGESGAGKTEAAKKIMQYISEVSAGSGSSSIQEVKDMVLATNPLLESLGCAKTLRNNNSSRHGKYLEILFGAQGEPVGARITNYLLEKARVVGQIRDERNFHIFYQLCKAASPAYREEFGLTGPEGFHYTSQAGCLTVDGIDDTAEYADTLSAMQVIGLTQAEQRDIHRILSAILWLGNTTFVEDEKGEGSVPADYAVPAFAASLLGLEESGLSKALTTRTIETSRGGRRGSIYDVPLNPSQASATRDALSMALYARLFEWIITRINLAMQERSPTAHIIGVLDIYGFEIFDHNSFEQLCINYVNEKLQQIFIELTLKAEQEEYVQEEIQWTPIKFFNNKIVCDLIEERRPPGIFAAMNDACATAHADPAAADGALVQRMTSCSSNPHFQPRGQAFLVKHYAGDVLYEVTGMTEKNKDQLVKDILELLTISSTDPFITDTLFPERVDRDSKKRPPTASDRIKASAGELVTKLMQSQPLYIRCIKPNSSRSPGLLEEGMVMHQVKYLGLHENVRIRRAGFASRQTFEKFLQRFYLLSGRTSYAGDYIWDGSVKDGVRAILQDSNISKEEWQMGKTKVFIRHPETLWALEHLRERYWHNMAQRIQRSWRAYQRYRDESARRIQGVWKRNKDQIGWLQLRDYGHQVLSGRKERRRASLISMRRYRGDYLGITKSMDGGSDIEGEGAALRRLTGLSGNAGEVAFSGHCQVLTARPLRSSKPAPRVIILTGSEIILVATTVEKRLAVQKVERRLPLSSLRSLSLSNLRDDWLILHVNSTATETDIALISPLKTELLSHILQRTGGNLTVQIAPEIPFVGKPGGKAKTLRFIKDDTLPQTGDGTYKSHTISVPSGEAPGSVSAPPCARKDPPPRPISKGRLIKKGGPSGGAPRPRPVVRELPQDKADLERLRPGMTGASMASKTAGTGGPQAAPPIKMERAVPPPPVASKPSTSPVPTPFGSRAPSSSSSSPPPAPTPSQASSIAAAAVSVASTSQPTPSSPSPPGPSGGSMVQSSVPPAGGNRSLPPVPPSKPVPSSPSPPKLPRWKALFDFDSQQEGEIVLVQGEVLEILEKNENGWWLGRRTTGKTDEEGWVPSNYLEEVKEAEVKRTPPPPPARRPIPTTPGAEEEKVTSSMGSATTKSTSPSSNPSSPSPPTGGIPIAGSSSRDSTGGIPQWKRDLAARNAKKSMEGGGGSVGSGASATVGRSPSAGSPSPSDDALNQPATIGSSGGQRNVAKLAAAFMQGGVMGMPPPGVKPVGVPANERDTSPQGEAGKKIAQESDDEWE